MTVARPNPGGKWCPWCGSWAMRCYDWGHAPGWYVPAPPPPRQRSVVGTTLVVLFTIFVIAPFLVGTILYALIQIGAMMNQ